MHGSARYKVPEGKLVEVRIDYEETIKKIEILGDFFVHPEESIGEIEESLKGSGVGESEESLAEKVRRAVELGGIEMIGVTPEAIAKAVKMAVTL